MRRLRRALVGTPPIAAAALAIALTPSVAVSAAPVDEPVPGYTAMGDAPEGANDWSCVPSAAHPRPVVLVHGTISSMQQAFPALAPTLAENGYCVFALNYGGAPSLTEPGGMAWGVGDIGESAKELALFVDAVLYRTGATQVDIVGHSQGGVVARQYLKYEGGAQAADPAANKVRGLVALGPTNYGTTFAGMQNLHQVLSVLGLPGSLIERFLFTVASEQQLVGSPLLANLNRRADTVAGVAYTIIASRNDGVITPPENSFLHDTNGRVRNVWVQDGCASREVDHFQLLFDERSTWLVLDALDPAYAGSHPAPC